MSFFIETAEEKDSSILAALHVAGWQGAYGGILDQDYIDSFTLDVRKQRWEEIFKDNFGKTLLVYDNEKAVGFISYGPLRTPPPGTSKIRPLYSSEIYALYLHPDKYRQGVGTKLTQAAVKDLMADKHQSMCLWVLEGNKRARGFYDKIGGQRIGKKLVEFGPTKAKELCYGWRDITEILNK